MSEQPPDQPRHKITGYNERPEMNEPADAPRDDETHDIHPQRAREEHVTMNGGNPTAELTRTIRSARVGLAIHRGRHVSGRREIFADRTCDPCRPAE